MSELDKLNDERDALIEMIAYFQERIAEFEAQLDICQVKLHTTDLQIKQLEINLRKAPTEQEPTHD